MACVCDSERSGFCYLCPFQNFMLLLIFESFSFQDALSKFETVKDNLEFARDLQKSFKEVLADASVFLFCNFYF